MDHKTEDQFQVSVKGMHYDENGKLMMIQEKSGEWELPGGRIQRGEDLLESLRRECVEETGLECEVLEPQPTIVYSSVDKEGRGRIMIFYPIHIQSLNFTPSDECIAIQFFSKEEIGTLELPIHVRKLLDYI